MNFCDDIKSDEVTIGDDDIVQVMDYLDVAFTEKRQYLKKVRVPIVTYVARAAMQQNITSDDFRILMDAFLRHCLRKKNTWLYINQEAQSEPMYKFALKA